MSRWIVVLTLKCSNKAVSILIAFKINGILSTLITSLKSSALMGSVLICGLISEKMLYGKICRMSITSVVRGYILYIAIRSSTNSPSLSIYTEDSFTKMFIKSKKSKTESIISIESKLSLASPARKKILNGWKVAVMRNTEKTIHSQIARNRPSG